MVFQAVFSDMSAGLSKLTWRCGLVWAVGLGFMVFEAEPNVGQFPPQALSLGSCPGCERGLSDCDFNQGVEVAVEKIDAFPHVAHSEGGAAPIGFAEHAPANE
jgi:hypothetical protein